MFTWYREAKICIAYLTDVRWELFDNILNVAAGHPGLSYSTSEHMGHVGDVPSGSKYSPAIEDFLGSRWFTRGWTLQELIASNTVLFYDSSWFCIIKKTPITCVIASDLRGCDAESEASKRTDAINLISKAAGVPALVLGTQQGYRQASLAQRMSWAASRQTTRIEDRAYSLMGIFDVNMPMLYGEGNAAFTRLREEIMKKSNEDSLLAYNLHSDNSQTLRGALSPASYSGCSQIVQCGGFGEGQEHFSTTNMGLLIKLKIIEMKAVPGMFYARLDCRRGAPPRGNTSHEHEDAEFPSTLWWSSRIVDGSVLEVDLNDKYHGYYKNFEGEAHDELVERAGDREPDIIAISLYQPPGHQGSNVFYRPTSMQSVSIPARLFDTDVAVFKTIYIAEKPCSGPLFGGVMGFELSTYRDLEVVETYPSWSWQSVNRKTVIRHPALEPLEVVHLRVMNERTLSSEFIRADFTYSGPNHNVEAKVHRHAPFDLLASLEGGCQPTASSRSPKSDAAYPFGVQSLPGNTFIFIDLDLEMMFQM